MDGFGGYRRAAFALRPIFSEQLLLPAVWKSRHGRQRNRCDLTIAAALILGPSLDSFGQRVLAGLENMLWFVERESILDLFAFVEDAHWKPFLDAFLEGNIAFEPSVYHMHIQTGKLETGPESIFSRYRVFETESELIRVGLCEFDSPIYNLCFRRQSSP